MSSESSVVVAAKAEADETAKASLAQPQGQPDDEDGLDLQMESLSKRTETVPVDSRTPQEREADSKAQIHCEAIFHHQRRRYSQA